MSSIEKLKIVGIRSFNPHSENVIEFHTPLTVIVGHNGAGKTTIIECLKYATTGEMPPNSKGGAFVHDPKLSRENDIKAQIKLKFRNTRQQVMVVTRSLQLTQTKAKQTLKTLESLLATVDPASGEQVSISSRCAQLDSEMPFHLGVSKAVLQNVIFCHQEESLWPLSESSVLKKKFDEIFAAERYTKALDTLKALRKQLMQDQKVEEEKLASLTDKRDLAMRLEADIRTADDRIASTSARIAGLDRQIEDSNGRLARIQADLDRISAVQGDYERLKHEHQMAVQSRADLEMATAIMSESDGELGAMLVQHEERAKGTETNRIRLCDEKRCAADDLVALERLHGTLLSERGQLWAEQKIYERRQLDLEMALDDLQRALGVTGPDVLGCAAERVQVMQEGLNKLQVDNREADTRLMEAIQALIGESHSLGESQRGKRSLLEEAQGKLRMVAGQLASVKSSLEHLEGLKASLAEEEAALGAFQASFDQAEYSQRLSEHTERRRAVTEELQRITGQLGNLSRFADSRARLAVKKDEWTRKADRVSTVYDEIHTDLEELLGKTTPREEADREVDRALRGKEREVRAMQERLEKAKGTHSGAQSKVSYYKAELEKRERELGEKRRKLDKVTEGLDFLSVLEEGEAELVRLVNDLTLVQSSKATYEAFTWTLGEKHACPLCERGFDDKAGETAFGKKLGDFLSSLPSNLLDLGQKKRALEQRLGSLKGARGTFDDVERLRLVEVPEIISSLRQAEVDQEKNGLLVEDLQSELAALVQTEGRLARLKKRTEELARLLADSETVRSELAKLETISSAGNEENIPPEQLQGQARNLQGQLDTIQEEYERLAGEMRDRQADLQAREARFRDGKESVMKIQLSANESVRLEAQRAELEESIRSLEHELVGIETRLAPLAGRIEEAKGQREDDRTVAADRETRERSSLEKNMALLNKAKAIEAEVVACPYDPSKLGALEGQIAGKERGITSAKERIASLDHELGLMDREAGELLTRERTIKDNLSLRALIARVAELRSKLGEMEVALGEGVESKEATMQALSRQQTGHSTLLGNRAGLQGELRQLEDQSFRHRQDLAQNFPDYEANYKTQLVRVTANSAAIDDLERYGKALDQAIMKYHGHKMDELNRLIKELWMATYQGADIDTIEIRAAHATEGAARTYNYRVVMLKGDSELDMRGRSSAGQRVLASLIIRLALAETFGQSCGILALDEPTTNLDRDNIEALAAALADIIRARRQQANFQLVIITHDEEFVEMLGRYECADYYYRVFKDESQYSTIEQQAFQGALH